MNSIQNSVHSVEIVIPVYNEQVELEDNINKLNSFLDKNLKNWQWSILIADNASTDDTYTLAKNLSKSNSHVHILHLAQKGRGRAVKKAWGESTKDVVAYMDIDLSTQLKHFIPLINSLINGFDIAIGSRLLPKSIVKGRTLKREFISRCYNLLIKFLFWSKFSDAQCGFKAITKKTVKELIPHIVDNDWFFDSEMLIVAEKAGYKIFEEPVTWIDDPGSTVKVMKTATGDLKGLWRLFKTRPWRNIPHKMIK